MTRDLLESDEPVIDTLVLEPIQDERNGRCAECDNGLVRRKLRHLSRGNHGSRLGFPDGSQLLESCLNLRHVYFHLQVLEGHAKMRGPSPIFSEDILIVFSVMCPGFYQNVKI